MPTAYVLLNSDLGTDVSIITEIKQILVEENVEYEVRGVYGVYDIVLKISSDDFLKCSRI
mgnify:CR=1 FL=1